MTLVTTKNTSCSGNHTLDPESRVHESRIFSWSSELLFLFSSYASTTSGSFSRLSAICLMLSVKSHPFSTAMTEFFFIDSHVKSLGCPVLTHPAKGNAKKVLSGWEKRLACLLDHYKRQYASHRFADLCTFKSRLCRSPEACRFWRVYSTRMNAATVTNAHLVGLQHSSAREAISIEH